MKVLTEEKALELTEMLLKNDKDIKEELEEKFSNGNADVDLSNYVEKEDGKGLFSGSYNDLSDTPTALPASDVYDWAKSQTKPAYTADEVGALPNTTVIPNTEELKSYCKEYIDSEILGGAS